LLIQTTSNYPNKYTIETVFKVDVGDDNFGNLDTSSPLTASPKSPTDKKEMY
jgi:hypothetical protein